MVTRVERSEGAFPALLEAVSYEEIVLAMTGKHTV